MFNLSIFARVQLIIFENGLGGHRPPVQPGLMWRRVEPGFGTDTFYHINIAIAMKRFRISVKLLT
jgi:hypothetical protein